MRKISGSGTAPNTMQGKSAAGRQYDRCVEWAKANNVGIGDRKTTKKIDEIEPFDAANKAFWEEFGGFLAHDAVKVIKKSIEDGEDVEEIDDEPLAVGTALQYFSGVLNTIHQKPGAYDLEFFKPFEGINSTKDYSKVPWVSDIRREMKREMIRKMIHEGIPMALKAKGFSKEIMIGIANALIDGDFERLNSLNFDWRLNARTRAILATDYMAVGRASEVALSSWNGAYWSELQQGLVMNWFEIKTLQQKYMSFINDYKSYHLDIMHTMFFYFASGLDIADHSDRVQHIFPSLGRGKEGKASTDITDFIRRFYEIVPGVLADSSSKDLRYGPTTLMWLHPQGRLRHIVGRCGWTIDTVSERSTGAMLNYIVCLEIDITEAARILCDYQNIRSPHKAPKLVFINEGNGVQIRNFLYDLLHLMGRNQAFVKPRLRPFVDAMFATFLLWLDQYQKDHPRCQGLEYVFKVARKFQITVEDMLGWSKAVRAQWILDNPCPVAPACGDNHSHQLDIVRSTLQSLLESQRISNDVIAKQDDEIRHLKHEISRMKSLCDDTFSLVHSLCAHFQVGNKSFPSPSVPRKRKPSAPIETITDTSVGLIDDELKTMASTIQNVYEPSYAFKLSGQPALSVFKLFLRDEVGCKSYAQCTFSPGNFYKYNSLMKKFKDLLSVEDRKVLSNKPSHMSPDFVTYENTASLICVKVVKILYDEIDSHRCWETQGKLRSIEKPTHLTATCNQFIDARTRYEKSVTSETVAKSAQRAQIFFSQHRTTSSTSVTREEEFRMESEF